MKKTIVQKGVYYDSVKLMLVTRELKSLDGVEEVAVVMGTDLNKDTLVRTGLMTPEAEAASPTDMIVAVSCNTEETANYIFEHLDESSTPTFPVRTRMPTSPRAWKPR